jgi:outer membrane murein-binding lipoprotein Lpp
MMLRDRPLAREVRQLFEAVASGEHHIRGFTNRDLREKLLENQVLNSAAQTVQQLAGKVSRLLRLRDYVFPELYAAACG